MSWQMLMHEKEGVHGKADSPMTVQLAPVGLQLSGNADSIPSLPPVDAAPVTLVQHQLLRKQL
jgi:hypothetical protein